MTLVSVQDKSSSFDFRCFDCGVEGLNLFLRRYAKQNDKRGIGKTFVGISEGNIIGFFTLSSVQISFKDMPTGITHSLPCYPIPAIRIARLAVSKVFQKKGYGKTLLREALLKIVSVSENVGVYVVLVDAKESAKSFYEKYGFTPLTDYPSTYFLLIKTIKQAIKSNK